MKVLRLVFATLAIGVASISTAQARDSFSLGINIGAPYFAPQPVYYAAPPVVYYNEPVYYRQPVYYSVPAYYPQASFAYYGYGGHRHHHGYRGNRGWDNDDRGHGRQWRSERRGDRGWR